MCIYIYIFYIYYISTHTHIHVYVCVCVPVPVAMRFRAWVCGHSLAGIVGLNPTGDMVVCLLLVLCVVRCVSVLG